MSELANRDFASLLDDLIAASGQTETTAAAPTIPFDYLSVADELHSGRIRVADDAAEARYREASGDGIVDGPAVVPEPDVPLATEPEAIAIELGLEKARAEDFHRIRRRFAFANHPDRVAPHLRERAMLRMQVANMLIDEASQRAAGSERR
jgi:hypothetical protein